MKSFFQRVLPKAFISATAKTDATSPTPVSTPGVTPAEDAARPAVPTPAMAARRPLFSSNGEVAGFEFRIDDEARCKLDQDGMVDAQAAHVAAVLVGARLVGMAGRVGLARLPAAWLTHAVVPRNESGTLIGLDFDPAAPLAPALQKTLVEAVQRFRAAGARLAWDAAHDLGMLPDYLLVRPADQSMAELIEFLRKRPVNERGLPVIATDVASVEDVELAVLGGISFVSGNLAVSAPAKSAETKRLPPEVGRLAQLLNQLAAGADTADLVGEIKGDIGVSFRLLQRMNSPTFAHLGGVASIDQAVVMLGRNELHRWLSLMLLQFAHRRKLGSALQEIALWRSRLVELLAIERGEAEPGRFFTLGLASMLGLILKISPAEVVSTLSLPSHAEQALLAQAGPWHVYLRTATQVETHTVDDASAVVDGFGGAERVLALSAQAWAWAAENTVKEAQAKTA